MLVDAQMRHMADPPYGKLAKTLDHERYKVLGVPESVQYHCGYNILCS